MTEAGDIIIKTLAKGGQRALVIAQIICLLVKEGAELGALDQVPAIGADGQRRTIPTIPREWMDRLARGIGLGAFDKPNQKTARRAVDRILAPPLPAHVENETA